MSAPETLGALVREAMGCAARADLEVMSACTDDEPHACGLPDGHEGPHECGFCSRCWERGPWDDDAPAPVERAGTTRDAIRDEYPMGVHVGAVLEAWRREAGGTQAELAAAVGLGVATLRGRLRGAQPFTVPELVAALDFLGRPTSHLPLLFPADWDAS